MEGTDRESKLLAAKEKLASFQKKKRRKKRRAEDAGTSSETSSLADPSDLASFSDSSSYTFESDQGSAIGDFSDEEGSSAPRMTLSKAEAELRNSKSRITELEETLLGKQAAVDSLIEENDRLKSQLVSSQGDGNVLDVSALSGKEDEYNKTIEMFQSKIVEMEEGMKQRDDMIKQLSDNLKATTENRDQLQNEYSVQAQQLAQQVQTLQLQLQQAGEYLRNQAGEHGISAQALLEAKNELLAMHQVNKTRETENTALRDAITQRDEALQKMITQYNEAALTLQHLAQENQALKTRTETQVGVQESVSVNQSSDDAVISGLKNEIKVLKERENELQVIKVSYEQLQKEFVNLRETVKLKDESLQQMAVGLASSATERTVTEQNTKEIERLRTLVIEREKTMKEIYAELNINQQSVLSLQLNVEQKDHQLKTMQESLDQKDELIKEKCKLVDVKEQSLQQKEQSLQQLLMTASNSGDQVSSLHAELEILRQKDQQYIEQQEQIVALQEIVNSLKAQLQSSRSQMLSDADIGELGKQLVSLKEALRQKDISLQQMALTLIALQKGEGGEGSGNVVLEQVQEQLTQKENSIKELSVTVGDLQNRVSALTIENKVLKEGDGAASSLKDQMTAREKDVNELKETIKNKDKSLQQMAAAFKEYENEMSVIHKRNSKLIEEKDEKITALEDQMKMQDHELAVVSQEFENMKVDSEARQTKSAPSKKDEAAKKSTEKEVLELNTKLEKQKLEMDKLSDLLKQREQSLQQMSSQYSDLYQQFSEVSDENSFLKEGQEEENQKRKEQLQQLHADNSGLKQREGELISTIKELADREDQYQKLDEVIEMKDKSLHQLSQRLAEMTHEFDQITEENKSLKDKQNELTALNESYTARDKEIENLQQAIKQKDQSIISLIEKCEDLSKSNDSKSRENAEDDNRKEKLSRLENSVAEKDSQIESLQQVLAEKIEQSQAKDSELQNLQEIVKSRNMIFADMNERYDALANELLEIKQENSSMDSWNDHTLRSKLKEAQETMEHKEKLIQQLCDENSHLNEQLSQANVTQVTNESIVPLQTVESPQQAPMVSSTPPAPPVEELSTRIKQLEDNIVEREAQIDQLITENSSLQERLTTSHPTVTIPSESESLEDRVHELECIIDEKDRLMQKIHEENVKLANMDRPPKLDSDTTYEIQVLQGKLDEKDTVILDLETAIGEKETLMQQLCTENSELTDRLSSTLKAPIESTPETAPEDEPSKVQDNDEKIQEYLHIIELKEQLVEQLYAETDHLNSKLEEALGTDEGKLQITVKALQNQLEKAVGDKVELEKMLCTRDQNQSSIQQNAGELGLKLKSLEEENARLKSQLVTGSAPVETVENVSASDTAASPVHQSLDTDTLEALQEDLKVKTQMLRELQMEISQKESGVKELQDALSQRDAYIAQIGEQYKQITDQYNHLAQHTQTLTAENSDLKQQIKTPDTSLSNRSQESLVIAQQQSFDIDTPNTSLSAAQMQQTLPDAEKLDNLAADLLSELDDGISVEIVTREPSLSPLQLQVTPQQLTNVETDDSKELESQISDGQGATGLSFSTGFIDKLEQELSRKSQLTELSAQLAQSDEQSIDPDSLRMQLHSLLDSSELASSADVELNEDEMDIPAEKLAEIQAAVDRLESQDDGSQAITFSKGFVDHLDREMSRREQMQDLREELSNSAEGVLDVTRVKDALQKVTDLTCNSQSLDLTTDMSLPQEESIESVQMATCASDQAAFTKPPKSKGPVGSENVDHPSRASTAECIGSILQLLDPMSSGPHSNISQNSLDNLRSLDERLQEEELTQTELDNVKTRLLQELFVIMKVVTEKPRFSDAEKANDAVEVPSGETVPKDNEPNNDFVEHLDNLQRALGQLETENEELKNKSSALLAVQERLSQKELEVNQLKMDLQEVQAENSQIVDLTKQVCELKSQNESLHETQEKLSTLEDSFREQDASVIEIQHKLDKSESAVNEMRHQLDEKQHMLDESLAKVASLEDDLQHNLKSQHEVKEAIESKDKEDSELRKRIEEIETQLEESSAQLSAANEAKTALENDMSRLTETLQDKDTALLERTQESENQAKRQNELADLLKEKDTEILTLKNETEARNQTISEMSSRLDTADDAMKSKDRELNELRSTIEISGTELQNELATKEHLLSEEVQKCSRLERELYDNNGRLENKEADIEELHRRLRGQEENTNELQAKLSSSEQASHIIEQDLADRHAEIRELKSTLEPLREFEAYANERITTLEEQLRDKTDNLRAAEAEVEDLRTGMDESEITLAKLKEELDDREKQVEEMMQELEETDNAKKDLKENIINNQREIIDLRNDLEHKDMALSEIREKLVIAETEVDEILESKQATIDSLNHVIEQRNRTIADLQAVVTTHQTASENLDHTLAEKEAEMCEVKSELNSATAELHETKNVLKSKDDEINEVRANFEAEAEHLNSVIAEREAELKGMGETEKDLRERLENKDQEIVGLRAELDGENDSLRSSIMEKDAEIENLNRSANNSSALVNEREDQMQRLKEEFNAEREIFEDRIAEKEAEIETLQNSAIDAMENVASKSDEIAALKKDLIGENDTLRQTIADKITEIETLKAAMSAGSRSRTTSESGMSTGSRSRTTSETAMSAGSRSRTTSETTEQVLEPKVVEMGTQSDAVSSDEAAKGTEKLGQDGTAEGACGQIDETDANKKMEEQLGQIATLQASVQQLYATLQDYASKYNALYEENQALKERQLSMNEQPREAETSESVMKVEEVAAVSSEPLQQEVAAVSSEPLQQQPPVEVAAVSGESLQQQPSVEVAAVSGESLQQQPPVEVAAVSGEPLQQQPSVDVAAVSSELLQQQPPVEVAADSSEPLQPQPPVEVAAVSSEPLQQQPPVEVAAVSGEPLQQQPPVEVAADSSEPLQQQPPVEVTAVSGESLQQQPPVEVAADSSEPLQQQPPVQNAETADSATASATATSQEQTPAVGEMSTDVNTLQATVQQLYRSLHDVSVRYNLAAQQLNQINEEYAALKQKDADNSELMRSFTAELDQIPQLTKQVQDLEESNSKYKDDIERLTVTDETKQEVEKENEQLKKRDKENAAVVQQLMSDIEGLRKGQDPSTPGQSGDRAQDFERLRSELEEMHGQQIVMMKEQLREQMNSQVEDLTAKLRTVIAEKEELVGEVEKHKQSANATTDPVSSEAMESVVQLQVEQLRSEKESMEKEMEGLRRKRDEDTVKIQQLTAEIEVEESVSAAKTQLEIEINQLHQSLASSEQQRQKVEAEKNELVSGNDTLQSEIEKLTKDMENLQHTGGEATKDQNREIEKLKAELEEEHGQQIGIMKEQLVNEIQNLTKQLEIFTSEKASLESQLENAQKEKETLKEQLPSSIQENQSQLEDVSKENAEMKEKLASMENEYQNEIEKLKQDLTEAEKMREDLTTNSMKEIGDRRAENEDLQKRLDELEKKHQDEAATNVAEADEITSGKIQELKANMEETYSQQINNIKEDMKRRIKELQNKVVELQEEKVKLTKEFNDNEENFEKHKAELQHQVQQLHAWNSDSGEKLKGNEKLKSAVKQLREQILQYRSQIVELGSKLDSAMKERNEIAEAFKKSKSAIRDYEKKNPDLAALRKEIEDRDTTIQVMWIENEDLKAEVIKLNGGVPSPMVQRSPGMSPALSQASVSSVSSEQYGLLTETVAPLKVEYCQSVLSADDGHSSLNGSDSEGPEVDHLRRKDAENIDIITKLTKELESLRSGSSMGSFISGEQMLNQSQAHEDSPVVFQLKIRQRDLENQKEDLIKQRRDLEAKLDLEIQTNNEEKKKLTRQVTEWRDWYQTLCVQLADYEQDIKQLKQLREENAQYTSQIKDLTSERDKVTEDLKQAKRSLADFDQKNPNMAQFRKQIDEMRSTLQVHWIENEQLKKQLEGYQGKSPVPSTEEVNELKKKLQEAEEQIALFKQMAANETNASSEPSVNQPTVNPLGNMTQAEMQEHFKSMNTNLALAVAEKQGLINKIKELEQKLSHANGTESASANKPKGGRKSSKEEKANLVTENQALQSKIQNLEAQLKENRKVEQDTKVKSTGGAKPGRNRGAKEDRLSVPERQTFQNRIKELEMQLKETRKAVKDSPARPRPTPKKSAKDDSSGKEDVKDLKSRLQASTEEKESMKSKLKDLETQLKIEQIEKTTLIARVKEYDQLDADHGDAGGGAKQSSKQRRKHHKELAAMQRKYDEELKEVRKQLEETRVQYASEVELLQNEHTVTREKLREVEKQPKEVYSSESDAESTPRETKEKIHKLKAELQRVKADRDKLLNRSDSSETAEFELHELKMKIDLLETEKSDMSAVIGNLEKEKKEAVEAMQKILAEKEELIKKVESSEPKSSERSDRPKAGNSAVLQILKAELDQLKSDHKFELEDLKTEIECLRASKAKEESKLEGAAAVSAEEELEQTKASHQAIIQMLMAELDQLKIDHKAELERVKSEMKRIRKESSELRQMKSDSVTADEDNSAELRARLEELRSERDTLEDKVRAYELEKDTLETEGLKLVTEMKQEHQIQLDALEARQKEEIMLLRHEMVVADTESSSLATSLDEEALSLRKEMAQLLAEKDQLQNDHQKELLELREDFKQITDKLHALQQEKEVFQENTKDELNALRQQLSKAIEERDRLKKAVEGGSSDFIHEPEEVMVESVTLSSASHVSSAAPQVPVVQDEFQPETDEHDAVQFKTRTPSVSTGDLESALAKVVEDYEERIAHLGQQHESDLSMKEFVMNDQHRMEISRMKRELEFTYKDELKRQQDEVSRQADKNKEIIKLQIEQKFVEELRKARNELSAQHESELAALKAYYQTRLQSPKGSASVTPDSLMSPDGSEPRDSSPEKQAAESMASNGQNLENVVSKLQLEKQELEEARDTLMMRISSTSRQQDALEDQLHRAIGETESLSVDYAELSQQLSPPAFKTQLSVDPFDLDEGEWRVRYDALLRQHQTLQENLHKRSPSLADSLDGDANPVEAALKENETLRHENVELKKKLNRGLSEANPEEDFIDLKRKFEAVQVENDRLKVRLQGAGDGNDSVFPEAGLQSRYEALTRQNEVLRAKLGSYGLPTEATPEEDMDLQDLHSKFEVARKDNEKLRTKLNSYTSSTSTQSSEDWQSKYHEVAKDHREMQERLNNAETENAEIQMKYSAAEAELSNLKEAHKKTLDKAKKENTKLKAKVLAASKGKKSDSSAEETASPDSVRTEERITELEAENEKLQEELATLKTRQLGEMRSRLRQDPIAQSTPISSRTSSKTGATQREGMRSEEVVEDVEKQLATILEEHQKFRKKVPKRLHTEYDALQRKHRELKAALEKYRQVASVAAQKLPDSSSEGHYIPEEDSDSKSEQASGGTRKRGKGKKKSGTSAKVSTEAAAEGVTSSEDTTGEAVMPVESSQVQATTVSLGRPKHVQNVPLHAHSFPNLSVDDSQLMMTPSEQRSGRRGIHRQDASLSQHDSLNWQFSSDSYGEFIPESDSEPQTSRRGSDAFDMHYQTDIFGNTNAPLANFEHLADAIAPIKEEGIRETLAEQVHDIHKKYVNLIETNSSLRMQLSEITIERGGLRSEIELLKDEKECLVQMIGKEKADNLFSNTQDSSEIESEYYSCGDSSKPEAKPLITQAPPQVKDLEQTIYKLREQNEVLVQQNLKLTSQLQPESPKAAWESDQSQELEFDFESFKTGSSPISLSEPTSPVSPRTGPKRGLELQKKLSKLKEQNELLLEDNLTLTSKFESQVSKAAWEIKTMKSSYEEEMQELTMSLTKYQEESARLKDAYTELKIKYECLTDSENIDAKMQIISELDKSRQGADIDNNQQTGEAASEKPKLEKMDSFSSFSGDEIILDDDTDVSSLQNKSKELQKEIRELKKKIKLSEDATYMLNLREKNKVLQEENQELQTVIDRATNMRELQQLRRRDRAMSSENEELRMKLNEAILQPNIEVDSLRERSMMLEEQNRSLFDRLDNDVIKAEEDVMELRRRCDNLVQEKEEIEDDFKMCREKLEKDILSLQHRYEEAIEENNLLLSQINSAKDTAQHSVHQMQVQFEDLSKEHEILLGESDRDKDKNRKEINDLRNKVESLQKENSDLRRDLEMNEKEVTALRESSDSCNGELKDQNTTLKREVTELSQKSEEDDKNIDNLQHEMSELKSKYDDLQKYCDEIKSDLTNSNRELSAKLEEVEKDNEMMSESMKDLKNAKASLAEELSDVQAWYETKEREYVDKISRMSEETKTLKLELNTTEKYLTESTEKIEDLEKHVESVDKRNHDLETLNTEYKGRVATLVNKLEVMQNEMAVSEEERGRLKDEVKEVMAGIEELADFDAEVWKTKQGLLDELSELKVKYSEMKNQNKEALDKKERMEKINEQIKLERDLALESINVSNNEKEKLREDIRDLMSSIEELADFDAQMWKSKESLVGELKSLQEKYHQAQQNNSEAQEQEHPSTPVVEQVFVVRTASRPHSESEDFGNVRQQIQNVMSENETLKAYVQTLKTVHEALKQNHEDCLKEKEALSQDVNDLMASLEELVAFDAEMWKGKTAVAGELQDMRDRYDDMQRTVQRKQEEIEKRRQAREEVVIEKLVTREVDSPALKAENEHLKRQLNEMKVTLNVMTRDFNDSVTERERLKEDVKELMASIEELVSFDAEMWKSKSAMSGELEETKNRYEQLQGSLLKKQKEMEERNRAKPRLDEQRQIEVPVVNNQIYLEEENKRFKEQLMEMSFDLRSLREDCDQVVKERDALRKDVKELMESIEELVTFDAEIWKSRTEMSEEFNAMKQKHENLHQMLKGKEQEIQDRSLKQEQERQTLHDRKESDLAQVRSRVNVVEEEPSVWMDEKGTQLRCVVDMADSPVRRSSSPEKNWQDKYVNMQWKYVDFINTIEEMSEPMSPTRSRSRGASEASSRADRKSTSSRKLTFSESEFVPMTSRQPDVQLTGEMGCDQCMILLEDNDRLRENLSRLQNDLMSTRLDRLEVETSYSERNYYKEQKELLEDEVQTLVRSFKEEKDNVNEEMKHLQEVNESLNKENEALKEKIQKDEEKYRELIHKGRSEVLAQAGQGENSSNQELLNQLQLADSEIKSLEDKVKSILEERTRLDIEVEHLKRECRLCERHIKDLEKEVETQYAQLDEMTLEHRELIELIAETKLQLEINRQHQARNVGKMEDAVSRLEETMSMGSGASTPRGARGMTPISVSVAGDNEFPPRQTASSGQSTPRTTPRTSMVRSPGITTENVENSAQSPRTEVQEVVPETITAIEQHQKQEVEQPVVDHNNTNVEQAKLEEKCTQLEGQRDDLLKQIEKQEELIKTMREQLSGSLGDLDENSVVRTLEANMVILETQRNELKEKLESSEDRVSELVAEKAAAEERFRRERLHLLESLNEKGQIQAELIRKIEILERHIRRQWSLEVMKHQRNLLESEMEKQKQVFEMELDTIDTVIRERAGLLSSERGHLVARLDHLEGLIGRMGQTEGAAVAGEEPRAALEGASWAERAGRLSSAVGGAGSMQVASSPTDEVFRPSNLPGISGAARPHTFREPHLDRLSGMKAELERRYRMAIAKLRTNMKAEASKQRKRPKPDA